MWPSWSGHNSHTLPSSRCAVDRAVSGEEPVGIDCREDLCGLRSLGLLRDLIAQCIDLVLQFSLLEVAEPFVHSDRLGLYRLYDGIVPSLDAEVGLAAALLELTAEAGQP